MSWPMCSRCGNNGLDQANAPDSMWKPGLVREPDIERCLAGDRHLERRVSGGYGRHRHGLRGAAADGARQRHLGEERQIGPLAKLAPEKYFLMKMQRGSARPLP